MSTSTGKGLKIADEFLRNSDQMSSRAVWRTITDILVARVSLPEQGGVWVPGDELTYI